MYSIAFTLSTLILVIKLVVKFFFVSIIVQPQTKSFTQSLLASSIRHHTSNFSNWLLGNPFKRRTMLYFMIGRFVCMTHFHFLLWLVDEEQPRTLSGQFICELSVITTHAPWVLSWQTHQTWGNASNFSSRPRRFKALPIHVDKPTIYCSQTQKPNWYPYISGSEIKECRTDLTSQCS